MEVLADIVKIFIPSALVLYGMYIVVNNFLNKQFERHLVDLRQKNQELITPIRLQAYERIVLLLERISPHNMLIRVNDPALNVGQLQEKLLMEIREEFNHNLSQQVYVSSEAWSLTFNAKEEIVRVINTCAEPLDKESQGMELARSIFQTLIEQEQDPTYQAITYLKNEISHLF